MLADETVETSCPPPIDAWRGDATRLTVPRSPSPPRSVGWDGPGEVPGLEISFDSLDKDAELEEEQDLSLSRIGSASLNGCKDELGADQVALDASSDEMTTTSYILIPPLVSTSTLGPFGTSATSASTPSTRSAISRESAGRPSTPTTTSSDRDFVCLTTPWELDNYRSSLSSSTSVPILLGLACKTTDCRPRQTRRESAPSLSSASEMLPFEQGVADLRRASEGHKRSMSILDKSFKATSNPAPLAWDESGSDSNIPHISANSNWSGLKRALSLGSSSSSRSSGNHVKGCRPNGVRRLSNVEEQTISTRAQHLRSDLEALDISHHHLAEVEMSDRHDHHGIQRGPASGPSSPCSSPSLAISSDDDRYALDDHIFALKLFPKPPGRILSDFDGIDETDLGHLHFSLDEIPQSVATAPTVPLFSKLSKVVDDSSPTIPRFGPFNPSSDPAQIPYCPPSPALTPSPHLSFNESTLIKTPYTPTDTYRDSSVVEAVDKELSRVKGIPLIYNDRSNDSTPSITAQGQTSLLPTASSCSSPSSAPVNTASKTTMRPTSPRLTVAHEAKKIMGDSWCSPDTLDSHPPITASSLPALPAAHPFTHTLLPSAPSSARTFSTSNARQESSQLSSPPTSYTQLSRRQSKFTSFSGSSSASSIRSADSTNSSIRYGHAQHWGLGEKPDISTVFEEEGSITSFEKECDLVTSDKALTSRGLSPQHRDITLVGVAPSGPKDFDETGQHLDQPSPTLPSSNFYPKLKSQSSFSTLVSRQPPPPVVSQTRTHRSGTISSEVSGLSSRTNKSAPHPFASVNVRPVTPPLAVPQSRAMLSSSRSQPNLVESYSTPAAPSPPHQVQVSESVQEEGNLCPVCNESLTSEYRIFGERPHVVGECGHEVHHECFLLCYGEVPAPGSRRAIGVCGICRQPMRVAKASSRRKGNKKGNKLAALIGQSDETESLGANDNPFTSSASIRSKDRSPSAAYTDDPKADDPIVTSSPGLPTSISSRLLASDGQPSVIVPTISIRSEFTSIAKSNRGSKGRCMTTMVSVTVPRAGDRGKYPAMSRSFNPSSSAEPSPRLPPSPESESSGRAGPPAGDAGPSPFGAVVADLQARVTDYSSQGLDAIGPLRLFDILSVRKGSLMREFNVYLFEEALICITEEKKSGIRHFFGGSSSKSDSSGKTVTPSSLKSASVNKGALKLKGRIYLKHVKYISDTSKVGELSLTIVMIDERMDSFILVFKERGAHGMWKSTLEDIVQGAKAQKAAHAVPALGSVSTTRSRKIAQLMGELPPMPLSADSSHAGPSTRSMTASTSQSFGDIAMSPSTAGYTSSTPATSAFNPVSPSSSQAVSFGDLVYTAPLGPIHTAVDVIVIFSIPAAGPGTTQTPSWQKKTKMMRESIVFLLSSVGPRDRVSIVSSEHGPNGVIRRTPFLSPARAESRWRLEAFVDNLGAGRVENDDNEVVTGREERVDVVTAMNVALDAVLQRKAKNPLGVMIVVSDSKENIKRAQMDLVTARLDAANIPVHALGYGKGHDPSPLWMISNHTYGTYTFVRDWYDLQNAFAGVLGGLMSVAITNMRLHLTCSDNDYKILRLAGASNSSIHANGKHCEIELREMRFGETREVIVEVDYTHPSASTSQRDSRESSGSEQSPAEGDGSNRGSGLEGSGLAGSSSGLEALSVSESNALEAVYESALIDEEPVLEVDCSYHDPAVNRSVSRLNRPVLLTCAILPPTASPPTTTGDPAIIRRRMEVLASDMITRALLIASRRNYIQASKILSQTMGIVHDMADRMRTVQLPLVASGSQQKSKKELAVLHSLDGMMAVRHDLEEMIEGMGEHPELFERDTRNFAAQQAVVYRLQKSWTTNTKTEAIYCVPGSREMMGISGQWQPSRDVMSRETALKATAVTAEEAQRRMMSSRV